MKRQYLTEDIDQIQRYFPGAHTVALHTPFDITPGSRRLVVDTFRAEHTPAMPWQRGLRWTI